MSNKPKIVKESDKWKTPKWIMNHFTLHDDPCPVNHTVDGLTRKWFSPAYVNPPYSNPLPWVEKAIKESRNGVNVIMLLKVDPSTKWYRKLIEANAHFVYFNERLYFNETSGSQRPNFANMFVFLEGYRGVDSYDKQTHISGNLQQRLY